MTHRFIYPLAVLTLALVFAGCHSKGASLTQTQAPTPSPTAYPDGVRRVTIDEMEALVKEGKAVVIDVRSQDSYDAGHIPGAKLIPANDIVNRMKELPKDRLIITYCS